MPTNGVYTVLEMCTEGLREAGVLAIDEDADAETFAVAIKRLNMMLKAWQNSAITIWKQSSGSITITDATLSYAIAERPLRLDTVTRKTTGGIETSMISMTRDEYKTLPDKDSTGTPSQFYYHRQLSQGELFVWPVMAIGSGTIEWSGVAETEDVTLGSDAIDVPSEWYEATVYGLAYRLCGAFSIDPVKTQMIQMMARDAYRAAMGADVEESVYFMAAR